MFLRIELLAPKKLVGKSLRMSIVDNRTQELWKSFMTKRKEVKQAIGTDLYSIQVYHKLMDYRNFDPTEEFIKWAAMEVENFTVVPDGLEALELHGGIYAVFRHTGTPNEFHKTLQYIFVEWLPSSGYELDHRPHFELLGEQYKNNHPESEEEVWIPVMEKS